MGEVALVSCAWNCYPRCSTSIGSVGDGTHGAVADESFGSRVRGSEGDGFAGTGAADLFFGLFLPQHDCTAAETRAERLGYC